MTARRYTQAQIDRIFADAESAADKRGMEMGSRYAFILGHVSMALGVPTPAVRRGASR